MKYEKGGYDLKAIQNIMLEMMLEIDRVCRENNIKYILDGGSMLGAVRHKGFIPWDDDLDLAMMRDDYIKFTSVANQCLKAPYEFQCVENTREYPYNFGKVFHTKTKFLEHFTADLDICHGVYIDIFPMDYVDLSDEKTLAKKRRLVSKYTQARYYKLKHNRGLKASVTRALPLSWINKRGLKHMMYFYKKGDHVQKISHFGKNKPPIPTSMFTDTIRVPFEQYAFPIPREYDEFLKGRYGDYMKLPPIEDQRPLHHIIGVEL